MTTICKLSIFLLLSYPLCTQGDIVAQWRFDESLGSSTATASVGGVDGALSGSAAFVPGGISGNALSLTRAGNGHVNMGNNFPFTSGDFTIVAWVKTAPDYPAPDAFVLSKHRATIIAGYILGVNANVPYGAPEKAWFYDSNGTPGDEPTSTTSVNDGEWHQIVGLYRAGGDAEIHVNGPGAEDSKPADVIGANSAPFLVGGVDVGGQVVSLFDGLVDEVQLYDHALNACQLQYLFDNPADVIPADCDQDGVVDSDDNCTLINDPSQRDSNGDGFGNRCDADLNGDCIVNAVDLGVFKGAFFTPDPDSDLDGDGIVNVIDLGIFKSLFFLPPGPSGLASCP